MVSVWQMGVLLAGIGFLILCIFAATTIRDVGSAIKRVERIITDKNGEIESIIEKSVSITESVDGITSNINKATNVVGIVSSISAGIASKFGSKEDKYEKYEPSDVYPGQMDIDDIIESGEDVMKENL